MGRIGSRRLVGLAAIVALVAASSPAVAAVPASEAEAIPAGSVTIEVERFVEIPDDSRPAAPRLNVMAIAGERLFVGEEHDGKIYEILDPYGSPDVAEFFDVGAAIETATSRFLDTSSTFHGGLRGLAFHPEFASNGLFYTSVMESQPFDPQNHTYLSDVDSGVADGVVIEWQLVDGAVDPGSYREVFRVGVPEYDHPIKEIAFNRWAEPGDDDYGLLYVAHGDGSVESTTVGGGLANDALGKILRVDPTESGSASFSIPSSNPFVGDPSMLDAVYTLGHRNPHNLTFGVWNGEVHFIVGEAGRDNVEEINILEPGHNYGWAAREGTYVHRGDSGGFLDGLDPLPADEWTFGYTYPAAQWFHQFDDPSSSAGAGFVGQAAAGGHLISNGSDLNGWYFHADFAYAGAVFYSSIDELLDAKTTLDDGESPDVLTQASIMEARVIFDEDNNPATPAIPYDSMLEVLQVESDYEPGGDVARADLRFGQSSDGTLFITNKRNGWVYRVVNSIPPAGPGGGGGDGGDPGGGTGGGGGTPGEPDFTDDDGSIFEDDIEWLAQQGITRGCNPPDNDRFCPDDPVTRGQMAAFLGRALGLPSATTAGFSDVADSVFAGDIDRLAGAGVTRGCNPPDNDRFCPDEVVTRGQMAAFLVRAYGYTATDGIEFTDDDGSVFENDIRRLAAAGVTRGCNPPANDRFCPSEPVTRGQMAAFLRRAAG